jgi:hypothetical protein
MARSSDDFQDAGASSVATTVSEAIYATAGRPISALRVNLERTAI